jgi:hypothetical protein
MITVKEREYQEQIILELDRWKNQLVKVEVNFFEGTASEG